MTHTHRDGSFVCDESRDIFSRASSLVAERVGESSASTEASHVEAQVMTELLGPDRYGRVRGYGVGVTPTHLSDVRRYTQDARESSSTVEIRMMEARMDTWIETIRQSYDPQMDSMRSQIEQLTSVLQTFVRSTLVQKNWFRWVTRAWLMDGISSSFQVARTHQQDST